MSDAIKSQSCYGREGMVQKEAERGSRGESGRKRARGRDEIRKINERKYRGYLGKGRNVNGGNEH